MRTNNIIYNIIYFEQELKKSLAKMECNKSSDLKSDYNCLLKLLAKYYLLLTSD